jgi:hypothetical protein
MNAAVTAATPQEKSLLVVTDFSRGLVVMEDPLLTAFDIPC